MDVSYDASPHAYHAVGPEHLWEQATTDQQHHIDTGIPAMPVVPCTLATDADNYQYLSNSTLSYLSSGSLSSCSHAGVSSSSYAITADADTSCASLSLAYADMDSAGYLSSASLGTATLFRSAFTLAGTIVPAASLSPFSALAGSATAMPSSADDWLIGTVAPQPGLSRCSQSSFIGAPGGPAAAAADPGSSPAINVTEEEVTDPLLVAAHAVLAAAAAAAPPGTTTCAADTHTVLAACDGSALLLLEHGSTTIGSPCGSVLSCASLDHLLQQRQASCSLCSSPRSPQQLAAEAEQRISEEDNRDIQLQLPAPVIQRPWRTGLVLQALPRSRRMGMLVCRPVGAISNTAAAAAAAQPPAAAMAAAAAEAGPSEDTSRSMLVLGLSNATAAEAAGPRSPGLVISAQRSAAAAAPAAAAAAAANGAAAAAPAPAHSSPRQQPSHHQGVAIPPAVQPIMQLLSCSTLLSPSCSSTLLGSVNGSCLRIGSVALGTVSSRMVPAGQHSAGVQRYTCSSAAAGGEADASACACPSLSMPHTKTSLGQQLRQLREDQEQPGDQEEQQLIYLLD